MIKKKDKNRTKGGNVNKTGGSYKEKQPAAKPAGKKDEIPVDEDGDAKADHSVSKHQKRGRISNN